MTFQEAITKRLVDHGLFDTQAEKVMKALMESPASESMKGRWKDDIEGYPPQMMPVIWMGAKIEAIAFIDAECPKHWARPMFA